MRTVKRDTLEINTVKQFALKNLCFAYTREKRYWLHMLQSFHFQALLGSHRKIRDEWVKKGYQSISGLQARHWKLALQDAVETWDKYWQALFVQIRSKIATRGFIESERRYAYFLIKDYPQFAELMQGGVPEVSFAIDLDSRRRIAGYVRRLIKANKGKSPTVKKARSIKFDANCYDLFEHKGRQYIKVMSLERGKRIILPLKGKAAIKGNITLVFLQDKINIHLSQDLKATSKKLHKMEAVDFGYTEVLTDTEGNRYGQQFGAILTQTSDQLSKKMEKRNKLHALEKKCRPSKKANRIRSNNLGRQKLSHKKRTAKTSLACEMNRAINQLVKSKQPTLLITEDLSHLFTYNKSKTVNRKLSSWLRGELQDRISFKALAKGFRHEQVNPAYSSQTCPLCDFVDSKNRKGDRFTCQHCRHEDIADRVAAQNLARRYGDETITLYTPYREVKTIFLDRFHRRFEVEQSTTVPDRTLETVSEMYPPYSVEKITIAGREKSQRTGRSIRERNKK